MRKRALFFLVPLLFVGCATAPKSTLDLTQPEPYVVANERHYDIPFDTAWQKLVEELSKSFFVINNISKESNIINVSFSSDNPLVYIDCGTSTRTYEAETYTYPIAGDGFFKFARQAGNNAFFVYSVNRKTSLEGRINVYVAPDGDGSKVSVNARYILSITTSGTVEDIRGALRISHGVQPFPPETTTHSFNTNQEESQDEITCVSTGDLENMILDMVEK